MNAPKEDRRVRRTRRMLKQGLAELMREKDFKDITVKDITERMDLNRGTFYLHYTDTYDLLEKLENETLHDFQEMINLNCPEPGNTSLAPIIEPIVDYIVENADICKTLFENKASNDYVMKFHKLICDNGAKIVARQFPQASREMMDYFFSFITYGLIGLIKQWFDFGMRLHKHEIVVMADRIINAASQSLLCNM